MTGAGSGSRILKGGKLPAFEQAGPDWPISELYLLADSLAT
jgi:hypothetical protein